MSQRHQPGNHRQRRKKGTNDAIEMPRNTKTFRSDKNATPLRTRRRNEGMEKSPINKFNSGKHGTRIPDRICKHDLATDHFTSRNHLRSVKMNRQNLNSERTALRGAPKGRLLSDRRNMSKTSFEDSAASNELRMAFEAHPNKFELRIRNGGRNFECLRIPTRRASNKFELLRMNPTLPPD